MPMPSSEMPTANLFENPSASSPYTVRDVVTVSAAREQQISRYAEKVRREATEVPDFFVGPNVNGIALEQVRAEATGDLSTTRKSEWESFRLNVRASLKEGTSYEAPDNTTLVVLTNEETRNREGSEETNRRVRGLKRGNRPGSVVIESTDEGVAVTALGWGPYEAQTEIGRIKGMEDLSAEKVDGLLNSRALPTIRLAFEDNTMTKIELERMAERARISAKIKATENRDFDLKNENPREAFLRSLGYITNKINKGDDTYMPLPNGFTARSNGNPGELEIADSNYIGNEDAARIIIKTGITSEGAPGKNYTTDVLGVGIKMGNRIIRIDLNNKEDVQKIIGYLRPNKENPAVVQSTEQVQNSKITAEANPAPDESVPEEPSPKAPEPETPAAKSAETNERSLQIELMQRELAALKLEIEMLRQKMEGITASRPPLPEETQAKTITQADILESALASQERQRQDKLKVLEKPVEITEEDIKTLAKALRIKVGGAGYTSIVNFITTEGNSLNGYKTIEDFIRIPRIGRERARVLWRYYNEQQSNTKPAEVSGEQRNEAGTERSTSQEAIIANSKEAFKIGFAIGTIRNSRLAETSKITAERTLNSLYIRYGQAKNQAERDKISEAIDQALTVLGNATGLNFTQVLASDQKEPQLVSVN